MKQFCWLSVPVFDTYTTLSILIIRFVNYKKTVITILSDTILFKGFLKKIRTDFISAKYSLKVYFSPS